MKRLLSLLPPARAAPAALHSHRCAPLLAHARWYTASPRPLGADKTHVPPARAVIPAGLPPETAQLLKTVQAIVEEHIPFHKDLNIYTTKVDLGKLSLCMPYTKKLIGDVTRPAMHGGALCLLMDAAGGFAAWTTLADMTYRVSTVDIRVDFIKPAPAVDLICDAVVTHRGKRLIRTDMTVYAAGSDASHPLAFGRAVFAVHHGGEAARIELPKKTAPPQDKPSPA